MSEEIKKLVIRIGGDWFLERDPFDIGSGGCYYREPYAPNFASAEDALRRDEEVLYADLRRAGERTYAHA